MNCNTDSSYFIYGDDVHGEYNVICGECGLVVEEDKIVTVLLDHEIYDMKNTSHDTRRPTIYCRSAYLEKRIGHVLKNVPDHISKILHLVHARCQHAMQTITPTLNKRKFIDLRCFVHFTLYTVTYMMDEPLCTEEETKEALRYFLQGGIHLPKLESTIVRNVDMWKRITEYCFPYNEPGAFLTQQDLEFIFL